MLKKMEKRGFTYFSVPCFQYLKPILEKEKELFSGKKGDQIKIIILFFDRYRSDGYFGYPKERNTNYILYYYIIYYYTRKKLQKKGNNGMVNNYDLLRNRIFPI